MNEKSCLNEAVFVFVVQSWLPDPNMVVRLKTLGSNVVARFMMLVDLAFLPSPSRDYGNQARFKVLKWQRKSNK